MGTKSRIDEESVRGAYARWAPVYDYTFGKIADTGRRLAVSVINQRPGRVLEVGVGTGIALPHYGDELKVTGIDLSPDMLGKARKRVMKQNLQNIEAICEMDAARLEFEADTFDTVVAMYVMTVVPHPEKVMRELERVCKPGGEILIINHFAQQHGIRGLLEKWMAPASRAIGWHPDFRLETIMGITGLNLIESVPLRPLGLFTLLRFSKPESVELARQPGVKSISGAIGIGAQAGVGAVT